MDKITKEQRSYIMSTIHSKWTTPERTVHALLKEYGIKHTMHPKLKGHPDIAVKNKKIVIFINGCFWHGCKTHAKLPKSNRQFWRNKIAQNIRRDRASHTALKRDGLRVLVLWEHEIKKSPESAVKKVLAFIKRGSSFSSQ